MTRNNEKKFNLKMEKNLQHNKLNIGDWELVHHHSYPASVTYKIC